MTFLPETQIDNVQATLSSREPGKDYITLNAELETYGTNPDGTKYIQYNKDREAVRQYFRNHVNPNFVHFLDLEEKIQFLIENEYYEKEFIEQYNWDYVKNLYKQVYAHKFRFPTFVGAYKFYSSYALKTFDGSRYLESWEDRIVATALFLGHGNTEQATRLAEEMITGRFQPATPTFLNAGKKSRGELVSCFEAGTPVATVDGDVPIEQIRVGDMVMTHDGTYSPVVSAGSRMETQSLVSLRMNGNQKVLTGTPEHPVLVRRNPKNTPVVSVHEGDGAGGELQWVRLDQVQPGDMVAVSRNLEPALREELSLLEHVNNYEYAWGRSYVEAGDGFIGLGSVDVKNNKRKGSTLSLQNKPLRSSVKLGYDFGRFVGYYLSEGYVHKDKNSTTKGLRFTFGSTETTFIEDTMNLGRELFGLEPVVNINNDGSTNVCFWSAGLGNFFLDIIGTGFNRKQLPDYMVQAPNSFIYGMLVGVFRGDGCTTKRKVILEMSNPALIDQLAAAALRIGVLPYTRQYISQSGTPTGSLTIPNSTPENQALIQEIGKNLHKLGKNTPRTTAHNYFRWVNNQAMYRVDKTETRTLTEPVQVYNLEVENKHTYIANGYIVHNCFLIDVADDLNSIMRSVNTAAQLSKRGGGVALNLTNLRGKGDPIKKVQNQASGVIPVMKILEDTFSYANQLGARQGAGAVYLNAHHIDILDFLDTKRENADEKIRIKSLSLGVVIPDITLELARKGENMYLFSPYDLQQVYGKEMAWLYISDIYREAVENPNIRKKAINPREFLSTLAEIQMESGYPYILFEDAANRGSHIPGKINMSNLCVEILQPQEPSVLMDNQIYAHVGKDISCNLGSLNMQKALESPDLSVTVETAVRALTEVSDMSYIDAVPTVAEGNRRSHSIGLGIMNVAGSFVKNHMYYGDEESLDLVNMYFYTILFHAIRASNRIAVERGESFDGFEGSEYASGVFFEKFVNPQFTFTPQTAKVAEVFKNIWVPTAEDWAVLAEEVKTGGLWNAHLFAVPPTGSISYINHSTPSSLPVTSTILEKRTEGKLGSVYVPNFAAEGNEEYYSGHNMFEIDPRKVIDVNSVIQFYVDQSISLTLGYKSTVTTKDVTKNILYAFSKGKPSGKELDERGVVLAKFPQAEIKTLYYVRVNNVGLEGTQDMECVSCAL